MSKHISKDKSDANQAQIVAALRQVGAKVLDTHSLGKGVPDIFVLWKDNNGWIPLEIKARGGRLTEDEIIWWDRMGYTEPLIAHDDQEAAKLCGIPIEYMLGHFPTIFDRTRILAEPTRTDTKWVAKHNWKESK